MKQHEKHDQREALDMEQLESRLEMESTGALLAGLPSDGTYPVCICHFW